MPSVKIENLTQMNLSVPYYPRHIPEFRPDTLSEYSIIIPPGGDKTVNGFDISYLSTDPRWQILVERNLARITVSVDSSIDSSLGFFSIIEGLTPKVKFTVEGGLANLLTNKTGSDTVKGSLVETSYTTDDAFDLASIDADDCIGVVYEDGISDGQEAWVVTAGIADILLKDGTAAGSGHWVKASDVVGRADATDTTPPGLIAAHFREIGHCLQTVLAGTDMLARCAIHFN